MVNKITDVFFDLDHTLWDFDKNSALTFEIIFKKNNVVVDLEHFSEIYQPINLKYWKLYREEKVSKNNLRYGRLKESFDALEIVVQDNVIHQLSIDYIDYLTTHNHVFDGTIEILDYLKSKYKLHIITNGFEEVQQIKLDKSKIAHYFDTVTSSEAVGVKKPNPKVFNHALKMANITKENGIMIGDNYEADILGALNMGLDAICYNYHNVALENEIKEVKHLLDLKKYL
ncbi:YjjG family noncanonical pyrimidine nucleotidase [Lacinutrix sp. Bg11-31]|uniref:YjjG family noncanonical pyrimidine nucleotidase n=1 Tax=Lacinutrix sp. Bg11-31 TaxID=2057808 RepID=UPI000C3179F0|nr:YjjG family noncanonical pyrimidine nucleotidase [Lacinutrix sp. Bg11-31]AUC82352.1 noncanonical pyrimidine nucleotidase, YjjG family [Lacinutrix sp. Bg11-31]